jgi:hypothetical protein
MLGVPYISPSKPHNKNPRFVSQLPSARRDGKSTLISARKARTVYTPTAEPRKDLHQQFLATKRRKDAAISGSPAPFDAYVEPFGDDNANDDRGESHAPSHFENFKDRDDPYEADSEPEDSYEAQKYITVGEAADQAIQSSEDPRNQRQPAKRRHSVNKKKLEDAWDDFVVATTKLLTTTHFPKQSACKCNRKITLPVVDFLGKGSFGCKTDDLECSFEDFIICEKDCPFKDAMPGFLQKGCYPSTPLRPTFAFKEGVIKFFARMYFKGPSSKTNFCNAITSFIHEARLFSSDSNDRGQVWTFVIISYV